MDRNIYNILNTKEYDFIKTEERLKDRIMLLTFGGSIAYGLDTPESDTDIRGVVMPSVDDLIGTGFLIDKDELSNKRLIFSKEGFEQLNDVDTDTIIYSLNKIIKLLYKCNPNTIEILGCKPNHYAMVSDYGKILLNNKDIFLSKLAYGSFAGYARAQFQRLKNAVCKDSVSNVFHTINIADSINRMQSHFEREYPEYHRDMIKLFITDSEGNPVVINGVQADVYNVGVLFNDDITSITVNGKPITDKDVELRYSINFDKISNKAFLGIYNEIVNTVKEFNSHLGNRNHKKDDYHLNKHAMHLIRLYLMALDILNNGEIITYREKEHDFLISIKMGEYYDKQHNTFSKKFFDIVSDFDKKLYTAYENTKLPEIPDRKKINDIVKTIYTKYLSENTCIKLYDTEYPNYQLPVRWTSDTSGGEWYE